jgi:hypothetical protein
MYWSEAIPSNLRSIACTPAPSCRCCASGCGAPARRPTRARRSTHGRRGIGPRREVGANVSRAQPSSAATICSSVKRPTHMARPSSSESGPEPLGCQSVGSPGATSRGPRRRSCRCACAPAVRTSGAWSRSEHLERGGTKDRTARRPTATTKCESRRTSCHSSACDAQLVRTTLLVL